MLLNRYSEMVFNDIEGFEWGVEMPSIIYAN